MNYDQNQPPYLKGNEYNEYISKGVSYINNPSLIFLHERIISYLQELAFYFLRLNKLGINNEKIKEDIINALSSMVINVDYSEEDFFNIIDKLYNDMIQAKELYISVCKRNNLEPEILKTVLKNPKKLNLSDMITHGLKSYAKKSKNLTTDQENLVSIAFNIVKNICVYLVTLKGFGINNEIGYYTILSALNEGNSYEIYAKKEIINKFAKSNYIVAQELEKIIIEKYGEATSTEISCCTRPNKAILVSGSSLKELELLLETTKNKNIDIYTHDNLIAAHAYPKFKNYSHLVGHFSENPENYLLDFNSFPGSILMTRHSLKRVENLYRGGIFTTDIIAPPGVVLIKNNDFEPLLKSAIRTEGFEETIKKPPVKITLDEKQFLERIAEIAQKIERGEIKHFFVIGTSNHTQIQKEYFEKFLSLLNDGCFVLSFSYTHSKNNVLSIKFNEYWCTLFCKALEILTNKIRIEELNPIVLCTSWGLHTFSDVIYMKNIGINNIYLPDCPSNLFNPFLINAFRKIFDFKKYTNPIDDLKEILSE